MNVNSLPIRHARILLTDEMWLVGDVLVRDERIVEIVASITTTEVSREIDATGLVLLPGVIDLQVHFREPGLEHKEDLVLVDVENYHLVERQDIVSKCGYGRLTPSATSLRLRNCLAFW